MFVSVQCSWLILAVSIIADGSLWSLLRSVTVGEECLSFRLVPRTGELGDTAASYVCVRGVTCHEQVIPPTYTLMT